MELYKLRFASVPLCLLLSLVALSACNGGLLPVNSAHERESNRLYEHIWEANDFETRSRRIDKLEAHMGGPVPIVRLQRASNLSMANRNREAWEMYDSVERDPQAKDIEVRRARQGKKILMMGGFDPNQPARQQARPSSAQSPQQPPDQSTQQSPDESSKQFQEDL